MSGMPTHDVGDVRQAWGRVTGWLEQHAPVVFAALGGPGSATAVRATGTRMGVVLPAELRQWLLANDIDGGRRPGSGSPLVALGCEGVLPGGGVLLGLTDIERVHLHKMAMAEREPSADPGRPSWRREWVPVSAESDGFYGRFLDTRTGKVGSWTEGAVPREAEHASLAAFFQAVADHLEGSDAEGTAGRRMPDGGPRAEAIRLWARANGYLVNDRGRIPAAVREAYEASR
ncbi:histone-like nucleoid-structuring protein Lsr2 [Streptomyces sp. NPDC018057]|uniref:Lsr2 family DNA-binding protein n=1 Tax=unclassified Streptomyces TaxID=2593676 RepID=UPI00379DC63B